MKYLLLCLIFFGFATGGGIADTAQKPPANAQEPSVSPERIAEHLAKAREFRARAASEAKAKNHTRAAELFVDAANAWPVSDGIEAARDLRSAGHELYLFGQDNPLSRDGLVAVELYKIALGYFEMEDDPDLQGRIYHSLAVAHQSGLQWERAEVPAAAAARAIELAVQQTDKSEEPFEWARHNSNLAFLKYDAYIYDRHNRSVSDLFDGIAAAQAALSIYHPLDHAVQWSFVRKMLGLTLMELGRQRGDLDHLIDAREALTDALYSPARAQDLAVQASDLDALAECQELIFDLTGDLDALRSAITDMGFAHELFVQISDDRRALSTANALKMMKAKLGAE